MTVVPERVGVKPPRQRVLIVEDEPFIAWSIVEALQRSSRDIVGPFASLHLAKEAVAAGDAIDAAILDIKLPDGDVYDVAKRLHARGIPIGFSTGWSANGIPSEFRNIPVWEKPFHMEAIIQWLSGQEKRARRSPPAA